MSKFYAVLCAPGGESRPRAGRMEAMQAMNSLTYSPGRIFFLRLSPGQDLLARVSGFLEETGVASALFSAAGSLSCAVLGVFDSRQRVYVTEELGGPFEVAALSGSCSRTGDSVDVSAHAVLVDLAGRTTGGRLFHGTRVDHAELRVQELTGSPPLPAFDHRSGVFDPARAP